MLFSEDWNKVKVSALLTTVIQHSAGSPGRAVLWKKEYKAQSIRIGKEWIKLFHLQLT